MKNIHFPPDFVLIGAAKCGTTAFFNILCQHPEIFGPPVKEPHYFSQFDVDKFSREFRSNNVIDTEAYFTQEILPERFQLFIQDKQHYLRLFETAPPGTITGEASTSYLYSPGAAKRIRDHNPSMKILAILRNPIERAFSHYTMSAKYGYTTDDFLTAIQKDQKKIEKGWGLSHLFLELGHYDEQVLRYMEVFPRDQLHFIRYEEWIANPESTFNETFQFLNIDPIKPDFTIRRNVGEIPRFRHLNHWLHRVGLRQSIADRLPTRIKSHLRSWYLSPKYTLQSQDISSLKRYYEPRIKRLSEILNWDLTTWLE